MNLRCLWFSIFRFERKKVASSETSGNLVPILPTSFMCTNKLSHSTLLKRSSFLSYTVVKRFVGEICCQESADLETLKDSFGIWESFKTQSKQFCQRKNWLSTFTDDLALGELLKPRYSKICLMWSIWNRNCWLH